MTTIVSTAESFEKDVKHLTRKYPKVIDVVETLITSLENDERPGDKIPNVAYDVYKVRLKNPLPDVVKAAASGQFTIYNWQTGYFC
jgi:hypothetical protein